MGTERVKQYREEASHGQPVEVGGFASEFVTSTLENWQSEFLQLFSFVALTALLIHKGSAESRDGDDEMKQMLERIEKKLDAASKGSVDLSKEEATSGR